MTGTRWTDPDGHTWPVTGHVCAICGLPRIDVGDGATTHPTCVGPPPGGRALPRPTEETRR